MIFRLITVFRSLVLVLCPLFSARCVGLRIKCSWVPFELNFRRRSRHDRICLRPFEFPFLRVIVNVVTSLFNPHRRLSSVLPLRVRSFLCVRSRSSILPPPAVSSAGGETTWRGNTPYYYGSIIRCLVLCVSGGPVYDARESSHPGRVVIVFVGLYCPWYCPLSTVSPVYSAGECESLSQPTLP